MDLKPEQIKALIDYFKTIPEEQLKIASESILRVCLRVHDEQLGWREFDKAFRGEE